MGAYADVTTGAYAGVTTADAEDDAGATDAVFVDG